MRSAAVSSAGANESGPGQELQLHCHQREAIELTSPDSLVEAVRLSKPVASTQSVFNLRILLPRRVHPSKLGLVPLGTTVRPIGARAIRASFTC